MDTVNRTDDERRHTAVHEAGHAVIGRVLGMLCGNASISPNSEAGEAGYNITADPYAIQYAWECRGRYRKFDTVMRGRIITYMAGHEAEVQILGDGGDGDDDDRWWITMMLAEFLEDDERWDRVENRLRRATRTLVHRHRGAIERVAAALLARESLSTEELDGMVSSPRESAPP